MLQFNYIPIIQFNKSVHILHVQQYERVKVTLMQKNHPNMSNYLFANNFTNFNFPHI